MIHAAKCIAIGFTLAVGLTQAWAQQQSGSQPPGLVKVSQAGDPCRKEVKDYLSTLSLLRESAGTHVGDQVAGAYMSEAEVERIVQARGHCAAAQALKEKRARR
jgi:hypothetical protein